MAAVADINSINITGRLTRGVEVKATNGGTTIGNFSLAFSGVRKNRSTGEYEEVPNYIDCFILGTRAQTLQQFLTKGAKVAISGELRYQTWEKDGQKRSKHEIMVDRIQFLSGQKQQPEQQAAPDPWDMPF